MNTKVVDRSDTISFLCVNPYHIWAYASQYIADIELLLIVTFTFTGEGKGPFKNITGRGWRFFDFHWVNMGAPLPSSGDWQYLGAPL